MNTVEHRATQSLWSGHAIQHQVYMGELVKLTNSAVSISKRG